MPAAVLFAADLERDLASQLPESGLMGCRRLAEISIREVQIDTARAIPCIVRPVEKIKDFESELEIDSFRDLRVLIEVDIGFDEVRSTELHRFLVSAARPERRNGKVALGNSPREPSLVVSQLAVTSCIGVIAIVPVGVVISASGGIPDRWIGGRWAGIGVARSTHRLVRIEVGRRQRITRLQNARAADSPTASEMTHSAFPVG